MKTRCGHLQVECSLALLGLCFNPTSPAPIKLFHLLPTLPRSFPKLRAQSCHSLFVSFSFSNTISTSKRSSSVDQGSSPPSFSMLSAGSSCGSRAWKSPRSRPSGKTGGARRCRFGVLGSSFSASSSSSGSGVRPMSLSGDLLLLFRPLGGGARFVIFFRGVNVESSTLRARRRSLKADGGTSACTIGGDGS